MFQFFIFQSRLVSGGSQFCRHQPNNCGRVPQKRTARRWSTPIILCDENKIIGLSRREDCASIYNISNDNHDARCGVWTVEETKKVYVPCSLSRILAILELFSSPLQVKCGRGAATISRNSAWERSPPIKPNLFLWKICARKKSSTSQQEDIIVLHS